MQKVRRCGNVVTAPISPLLLSLLPGQYGCAHWERCALTIAYLLSNNINYISPPGNMGLPIGHTIHIYSSNLLDICPVSMGFPRLISHQGVAWLGGECLLLPSATWLTPKKLFSSLIRRAASRFEEVPAKAPSRIT